MGIEINLDLPRDREEFRPQKPPGSTQVIDPSGESLLGAYNRYLSSLSGGYSQSHSDSHLWYHGTIDFAVPTSDTQANITVTERQNWWTSYEAGGVNAGFYYSLIGRGNRLGIIEPAGAGTGRIVDGYNQAWDLGAGVSGNRFALPSNDGSWPNIIKLNINVSGFTGQNAVVQASTDLRAWTPLMTNTLTGSDWVFIDSQTATNPKRFYRVALLP